MKNIFVSLLVLSCIQSAGQGFFEMDTLKTMPGKLQGLVTGKFKKGFSVDFNGDGKKDFILEMAPIDPTVPANVEYWITSELKTLKRKAKAGEGYDYFWFVNLDQDREPEIFRASGYEDGIDYAFFDHNLSTGKETVIAYINPVILEGGKNHWGYPWDISGMILKREANAVYLRASFDHDIVREEEMTAPDPKKKFPAIFFYGHSTQPNIPVGEVRNVKWMTLEKLR